MNHDLQAEKCGSKALLLRLSVFVLLISIICIATGCGSGQQNKLTVTGEALGTFYTIALAAPPANVNAEVVKRIVDSVLEQIDQQMSTYREDSELSRFNRYEDADSFPLSKCIYAVFQMAQQISEESDGAFDVTVGPLVNAWGFGPDAFTTPPDEAEIVMLLERVGYENLTLHKDGSISKSRPDVYCDLSAIAKGYAVDIVAAALESKGISRYMVEVGGEIKVAGLNADNQPWHLGIEKPIHAGRQLQTVVQMEAGALASSGNYRNMYKVDGKLFAHTIDPKTGYPTQHRLASVSVIHRSCAMADGYATALMALGEDKAMLLATQQNLAVMFILAGKDGESFEAVTTPAFQQYVEE